MTKVKLSDFFRDDFLSIINSHKNRIQAILNEYDVAIYMARKAICLFDALMENDEIHPTACHIISSRVIDYDGLERFKGKKIAVIDDVVVKGTSIKRVAEKLSERDVTADYYVIACEESFAHSFIQQYIRLNKSYNHYTQSDIYKLSGLITQYIEASMRTFNVDSPIYEISAAVDAIDSIIDGVDVMSTTDNTHTADTMNSVDMVNKLLRENGAINLTSAIQRKYGISNQDLYFRFTGDESENPIKGVLRKSTLKIRFYQKEGRITAVPFVLLPECSLTVLEELYAFIETDEIDDLVQCGNENIRNENKYKIVSYLMATALFCSFARKFGIGYKSKEYFDIIQFDMAICRALKPEQFEYLCSNCNEIEICQVEFSQFDFPYFIKAAYEYITSINPEELPYTNWKGEYIGKTDSDEPGFINQIVFSFKDLYRGIETDQIKGKYAYVSSIIDVLIDKGFVVPSIVHIGDDQILRAYKMGEYSKLTREQWYSFVKMVSIYQGYVRRSLDRTEFEKLCVLFFRMQINLHNFGEETEFDDGYYSIGYSYYGPRISNSSEMYTVSKDSALVTDFVERGIVKKHNGKYHVAIPPSISDLRLENACNTFAYDYSELNKIFNEHPYRKSDNPWNQYIHTYDQYLTILAIGENRKNQILSLCAEIYQVLCLKEEIFFEDIDRLPVHRYRQMLSGIDSGLWKYKCFLEDALNKTTRKIKEYSTAGLIRGFIDVQPPYDLGERATKLRNEMGDFLFKSAYIMNELLRLCGRLETFRFGFVDNPRYPVSSSDIETIFSKSNFYYLKTLKAEIDAEIARSIDVYGLDKTIKKYFRSVSQEARYMLDQCDLYLEKNSPNLEAVKEFAVAFSLGGHLPLKFSRSKECIISNLSESSKVAVFSILNDQDREIVIDNLKIDTQNVEDCIYLLVTKLKNDCEGYVQFDRAAKGTDVTRNLKKLFKMIRDLPDKQQRLFVLRQSQEARTFENFGETRVSRIQESISKSSNYSLDVYTIEREKVMDDSNKGISVGGDFIVGGHFANGEHIVQQGNINSGSDEIATLIQTVLEAAKELSPAEQEEVKEYTDVIKSEVAAEKPKKNMIKTALSGLKNFVTNEKFINAVAKLTPVVLDFVEKLG